MQNPPQHAYGIYAINKNHGSISQIVIRERMIYVNDIPMTNYILNICNIIF